MNVNKILALATKYHENQYRNDGKTPYIKHPIRVCELLYDLGIYYVGRKIEKLYNYIKNSGELDNTLFVITSDHGFSYQGTPTREKNISTFYKENFHIPVIC